VSYRDIRDFGLLTLFLIILAISLFSYAVANRSTQRLSYNIRVEQARLKADRLLQLFKDSRDNFDDLRSAKIKDAKFVVLPLERINRKIEEIKEITVDDSQLSALRIITKGIKMYRAAVLHYTQAKGEAAAKKAENTALKVSCSVFQVMQTMLNRMALRINEKNIAIIKESYHLQKILGLALIGSIIAILIIAFWMSESIAKPITQLEEATRRIAKGDLETEVKAQSKDEIGGLFRSFNQMVAELRESRVQLVEKAYVDSIIANMIDALIVTDLGAKIMTVNKATCQLLGYTEQELNGKGMSLILPQEGCKDEISRLILKDGYLDNYELDYKRKDGSLVPMLFSGSVLKDNKGVQIGFLMLARDISERKELEKKHRLAELGKLVADMAHEVNNPLMIISGRAELSLMQDIKNEKLTNNLNIIVEYSQRAKDIIARLLRFSRPSKGELKEVDINKAIEDVVSIIEHQFELDSIIINKNYTPVPPVVIDEKQIQEVFMNLFNNARDAMPQGGTIQINTFKEDNRVRIEIKDRGRGIEQEFLDKIFDPFFTTRDKGTGLGISLCYNIVKSYGGDLKFVSQINKGTTAIITLPIKRG